MAIKASQCLQSGTCFNEGLLSDYFLSLIFRKSNQKYFQTAATRLVIFILHSRAMAPKCPLTIGNTGWRDTDPGSYSLLWASHFTTGSSMHWPEVDPALDPVLEVQTWCDLKWGGGAVPTHSHCIHFYFPKNKEGLFQHT